MRDYENIIVDERSDVLWIRLNRPRSHNALSRDTLRELSSACSEYYDSSAIKAVVLTGQGGGAFAAGGDLQELSSVRSLSEAGELWDLACAALDGLRRFPLPVVAALNGQALGGGAELALACDFRLAVKSARIGYIQARLNICSGFGGGADLMQLLGDRLGLLHALRASVLTAREALAVGMIDEVAVDGETLEDCVTRFLAPIVAQKAQVIRAYKSMAIAARTGQTLDSRRNLEKQAFCATWIHDDHWSAVDDWMRQQKLRASKA